MKKFLRGIIATSLIITTMFSSLGNLNTVFAEGSDTTDIEINADTVEDAIIDTAVTDELAVSTRIVPWYSVATNGGTWDGTYYRVNNNVINDCFFFDGQYTYYLQYDGTPMKDRLTYHPNGVELIYFDSNGHELFDQFQYCEDVKYTCYFDTFGYMYKNQTTFAGPNVYYLDYSGRMKQNEWFTFDNGEDMGYANSDGTLNSNGFGYDTQGRVVFYNWNGRVARGTISDNDWYYEMDPVDGHLLRQYSINSPVPGKQTIRNLLLTCKSACGNIPYASPGYRGTGLGVQSGMRMDCSGFVGWATYNMMNTTEGGSNCTYQSGNTGDMYAALGWGSVSGDMSNLLPGDIICKGGHCFIVIGTCSDGSVVLVHSTNSGRGVEINGTGYGSQAQKLAKYYMTNYTSLSYTGRADTYSVSRTYLNSYTRHFTWDSSLIADPDGYRNMSPEEILKDMFE